MNSGTDAKKDWTKEEIVAAIKTICAELGRVPSQAQMKARTGITQKILAMKFGNYTKALRACGLAGSGSGFMISTEELFLQWAGVVRKLGEVPSMAEFQLHASRSLSPFRKRFRSWGGVPEGMVQYAIENGLEEQWKDVVGIARRPRKRGKTGGWTAQTFIPLSTRPRTRLDRPRYGEPLFNFPLMFTPVNEAGVLCLLGALAPKLKMILTWIGTEFPDVEAMREVEPGRWQLVRIELEFLSRNFLLHNHNPEECDLIVCWENNWPECPVEVIELKKIVGELMRG